MTKITTDLTTHQQGIDMNGVQRLFADKAARDEINAHDTRIDTVQSSVSTETSRATAAEQQLQTSLNAEVTRATAAESTNATNISANTTAISTEASRAKGVEEGLTTRVTTLETDHTSMKSQIAYLLATNKGAGMRWKLSDTVKTIEYIGDSVQKEKILNWIDNSPRPCEVKKDGTDFAYLLNTAGVASETNWQYREDGTTASHYNTEDKADYLQQVEYENINMCFDIDEEADTGTVLFTLNEDCPDGFHRWFKEPTKLFARYDGSKNATNSSTYDIMKGGNWTGVNSVSLMHTMNKATSENLLEITGWEYAVFTWLMAFKYGSFDSQTVLGSGVSTGSQTTAEAFVNGVTDTLTTPHGAVSTTGGNAIRFMYMENPYGLRWIWTAGVRGDYTTGYFTYDEDIANEAALLDTTKADETFEIVATSTNYAKNVSVLGVALDTKGSSSTGFYDGNWSNIGANQRVLYVGGDAGGGVLVGSFARYLNNAVSSSYWSLRGRGAMKKSKVVSA